MEDVCIITECQFTRLAVHHFLDMVMINNPTHIKLIIIDTRYDKSVIEFFFRLFHAQREYPHHQCINITSQKNKTTYPKINSNVFCENESQDVILHKTQELFHSKKPLSCEQLYQRMINHINLTETQLSIAEEIASGLSSKQIAKKYQLSVKTVYTHMSSIRQKLHIATRYDLYRLLSRKKELITNLKKSTINTAI